MQRKPTDREADVANIKAAVTELSARSPVDPDRTTVMGFSDGASYALSIGMAYGLSATTVMLQVRLLMRPTRPRALARNRRIVGPSSA